MTRFATCFAIALAAYAQVPVDYSAEKERALGKSLASDFERRTKPLDDSGGAEYIQHLADRVASVTGRSIQVKLVDSADSIAAIFPGGFLYVSGGLIANAQSESELAVILAHQIAHLAAPLETPVYIGGNSGLCARFGNDPIPLRFQSKQKELEQQADRLAAGYVLGSTEDASEFQRLQARLRARYRAPQRVPPSLRNN
jgi:hypothetical protein